ncbi:fibroleukin-like isoform X2 [Drosophila montana]
MNTQNILTIQLEQSQEDVSEHTVSSNEWELLRDNAFSTISDLKKIKLSVYKEKLNLYHEKCKIKDDVILALQTCLETYKNTNQNDNDLIVFLKSKLSERHTNLEALKKTHHNQIANYEAAISEKNDKIDIQDAIIKQKDKQIVELEAKLKEKSDLSNEYKKQIASLEATVEESDAKMFAQETIIREKDYQIGLFGTEVAPNPERVRSNQELALNWKTHNLNQAVNCTDTENKLSNDKCNMQNERILHYTIKELQETLRGEGTSEIKIISLPRIGPFKVAIKNGTNGSGWMLIQRRVYKLMDFNQGWFSYVDGFGNLDEDFWIGLDKIHAMTKGQVHELYIHLVFSNNETRYAYYDNFAISGKSDDYKLRSLGNYFGNAGDGLRTHEQHIFKTIRYVTKNSVEYNRWWQHECPSCNLNGSFDEKSEFGVWWCRGNGTYKFLESVQMLVRRKQT